MGGTKLAKPMVGADGGVVTFGGAPFLGAAIGEPGSPVVAFAS